jgi:hypothetical protein
VCSGTATIAHRIPDLQLYLFAVNVHHPGPELNSNGQVMNWLEAFVSELKEQAALACCTKQGGVKCIKSFGAVREFLRTNSCIADDNVFEEICVGAHADYSLPRTLRLCSGSETKRPV